MHVLKMIEHWEGAGAEKCKVKEEEEAAVVENIHFYCSELISYS